MKAPEHTLAECRDAYPVPEVGSKLEGLWGQAMGDPASVSAYVIACATSQKKEIDALRAEVLKLHQSLAQSVLHAEQGWSRYESATRLAKGYMAELERIKSLEPVMIYHGTCTIDCGEHGHHHTEMLKMIPAGTQLYALGSKSDE